MRIAEIEILELQNIPITPPLFKEPVRAYPCVCWK